MKKSKFASRLSRFFSSEDGATAMEYGLLSALIAAALITAVQTLGNAVSETFNTISNAINSAS